MQDKFILVYLNRPKPITSWRYFYNTWHSHNMNTFLIYDMREEMNVAAEDRHYTAERMQELKDVLVVPETTINFNSWMEWGMTCNQNNQIETFHLLILVENPRTLRKSN